MVEPSKVAWTRPQPATSPARDEVDAAGGARRPGAQATAEPGALDELALARAVRARDARAVEVFLERFRPLLQHCIGQFEAEASAREDLFQDLVAYAFERLDRDRFDPEKGSLGTWLYRVAWCRCVDLKRRESTGRRLPLAAAEEPREALDLRPGPEAAAGDLEVGELVRRCLAEIDPEDAELLRMRHLEDMTLVDIAALRAQTLETVKYRIKRATEGLRRRLLASRLTPELVE